LSLSDIVGCKEQAVQTVIAFAQDIVLSTNSIVHAGICNS